MKKELDNMLNRLNQWEAENKDADLTQMEEAIDAELTHQLTTTYRTEVQL